MIELLNRKYLDRSGPTNVLAFSMQEGEFSNISPQLLGDVVISVETAYNEGKISGISLKERMAQLLVHGILHLFGFDHEKSEKQARKMEEKNKELMKIIKTGQSDQSNF